MGAAGFAGEIYKSVDAQGHVVLSDQPDPAAQKLELKVDPPNAAEAARIARDQKLFKVEEAERKRAQAAADKRRAQQEHDLQLRAQRCAQARSRYEAVHRARLLYSRDADGNKAYLSDQEADAKRAEALQNMQTECGP
jgi:hypothetical protein